MHVRQRSFITMRNTVFCRQMLHIYVRPPSTDDRTQNHSRLFMRETVSPVLPVSGYLTARGLHGEIGDGRSCDRALARFFLQKGRQAAAQGLATQN